MAEFDFALMLMELSLAIEKTCNNERSTKSCCNWLWNFWMNPTINLNVNRFDLLWHLAHATNWKMQLVLCDLRHWAHSANWEAQLDLWWSNFTASWEALHISSLLEMYASINWKMSWVPRFSEISADGCISTVAFNAVFGELICFVEVTGSNANNAKAWCEAVGVDDAWTFTARDWTQYDKPPNGQIVEKSTWADEKLCWLAKCKCAVWGLVMRSSWSMSVVSEYTKPHLFRTSVLEEQRNPLESRLIGVGWELSEAAIG